MYCGLGLVEQTLVVGDEGSERLGIHEALVVSDGGLDTEHVELTGHATEVGKQRTHGLGLDTLGESGTGRIDGRRVGRNVRLVWVEQDAVEVGELLIHGDEAEELVGGTGAEDAVKQHVTDMSVGRVLHDLAGFLPRTRRGEVVDAVPLGSVKRGQQLRTETQERSDERLNAVLLCPANPAVEVKLDTCLLYTSDAADE